ncbi:MAG: hypothetical protein ACRC4S_04350 [Cetobacterium sp.]
MSLMIGGLVVISYVIGKLASTGKEMYRDNLISEKELQEIRAKSKAFEQVVEHYKNKLDKAYNLEVLFLENTKNLIETTNKQIDLCLNIVEKLDDNSPKIEFYMKSVLELQSGVRDMMKELSRSEGKYFNDNTLKSTNIGILDFHNETNIGTREKEESREDSFMSVLPILKKISK